MVSAPLTAEQRNIINWALSLPPDSEGCGICERGEPAEQEPRVYWLNHFSKDAHKWCLSLINKSQDVLMNTICAIFNEEGCCLNRRNIAHQKSIHAVSLACGGQTIISYFASHGEDALVLLFRTVGVDAAKTYAMSVGKKLEERKEGEPEK